MDFGDKSYGSRNLVLWHNNMKGHVSIFEFKIDPILQVIVSKFGQYYEFTTWNMISVDSAIKVFLCKIVFRANYRHIFGQFLFWYKISNPEMTVFTTLVSERKTSWSGSILACIGSTLTYTAAETFKSKQRCATVFWRGNSYMIFKELKKIW